MTKTLTKPPGQYNLIDQSTGRKFKSFTLTDKKRGNEIKINSYLNDFVAFDSDKYSISNIKEVLI